MQRFSEVDRRLAAERHDDSFGFFEGDDVHHVLYGQRLEIELVAGGIVRRNGFGIVVDDDRLVPGGADRPDGMHGRIVELDALPDADRSRTEHHDLLAFAHDRLVFLLVSGIEIGHIGGELARAGIDHLINRENIVLAPQQEHLLLAHAPQLTDELVAKTHAFGVAQRFDVAGIGRYDLFELDDVLKLLEEEHVDFGAVVDQRQLDAPADQLGDGVKTVVRSLLDIGEHPIDRPVVEFLMVDMADPRFERAHRLQEALLHRAAHGHHLARRLHLGSELVRSVAELVEREAGDLGNHIVESRFEAGRRIGDADLVERKAHGDLGADAGDRIAAGLRRQSRRPRHAGIDLDQVVVEREGIERELHVAAAFDLQGTDQPQGAVAQQLILLVGQRLARSHHDRVARMDADRIDVFHIADRNGRIVVVADHLVFDLLIPLDALLDQHLMHRGEGKRIAHHLAQLRLVVGEAAARTAQRKGRTQHDGVTDPLRRLDRLVDIVSNQRRQHRLAQRLTKLLEEFAVLGLLDALERSTQNLHLTLLKHAFLGELHGQIQARLPAQSRHDGIGTLVTDDLGHVLERQRLHIDFIGNLHVGLDRRRIGIDQHDLVPLFLEGQTSLRTRVVELRSLADHDRAGADHHHFLDIRSLRHFDSPPSF